MTVTQRAISHVIDAYERKEVVRPIETGKTYRQQREGRAWMEKYTRPFQPTPPEKPAA